MSYEIQNRINSDINLKKYLRENSYWYKRLNRNIDSFSYFVNEMKVRYKLTTTDKFNRMVDNINMLESFIDVLKN